MFVMLLMALNHNIREMCSVFVFPASALESAEERKKVKRNGILRPMAEKGKQDEKTFLIWLEPF